MGLQGGGGEDIDKRERAGKRQDLALEEEWVETEET